MRKPDVIIGDPKDPYLLRWYIIPRNRFFNIYLHNFCKSDDDRALHDHPWLFNMSILLKGDYIEHIFKKRKGEYARSTLPGVIRKFRSAGSIYFRWGKAPHRVELYKDVEELIPRMGLQIINEKPVWTLFITGPKVREWGFYCPQEWRHWGIFTKNNGNETGRGCD